MQLVRVGGAGPRFCAHAFDRLGIESAQTRGSLFVEPAAAHHRARTAFFQRRVVEEGIRPRAQDLQCKRRRLGQVAVLNADGTGFDRAQQSLQSVDVHCLIQAIVNGLIHQRMVGQFTLADQIFAARHLIGKHRREEVFGRHALQLGRHLLARAEAGQRQ